MKHDTASGDEATDATMARLAAREHVLRLLALAATDPAAERFGRAQAAEGFELARAAAHYLAEDPGLASVELAPGEAPPQELDLNPLADALLSPRERLEQDHVRVFGLVVSKECPPYEVQYCPQTFSTYRSQRMADVAGFYRAFGLRTGRDRPERVDHVACELEFMAWLVAKERYALSQAGSSWAERASVCRDAQREFTAEHLAWWLPAFAHALGEKARSVEPRSDLHASLAQALAAFVPIERALLEIPPPDVLARPRPDEAGDEGGCSECATGLALSQDVQP